MTATAPEFPRQFIPAALQIDTWPDVERYYQLLLEKPLRTQAEFERWLLDWSELDAAFDEEATRRRVEMTCATDDPIRKQRFLNFLENVTPHREPIHHRLREKLVEAAGRFPLPPKRYEVLLRSMRNAVELFREENVPLLIEDAKLRQNYQEIVGAMAVKFQGQEMTLPQAARFLEEPDRTVREEAWRLVAGRYLQDSEKLDALYETMVRLRHKVAQNAGAHDYREYAFRAMERFDYTPDDCLRFHDAIEKVVVPAVAKLMEERRRKLKLETLRPWDTAVDPESRPPLRPFGEIEQLVSGCSAIFHQVDGELGKIFDTLQQRDSLDLASRKGKAPGGYQEMFDERRLPFIFMNAVGTESDVRTLLHEGGHAFHSWSCRNEPILAYRRYPIEFAEVASMGMECLSLPYLERFYKDDTSRARRRFFEEIVMFLPYMAKVDALQHFVYTHVDSGIAARHDEWQKLSQRFEPHFDFDGLEKFQRHSWHRKLHFFEVPFYYVEYGIAQLGALQVWKNSRRDYRDAVNHYRNGLALGGARPLPELFQSAGLRFDFSEKTLRPLIDAVMEEIARQ